MKKLAIGIAAMGIASFGFGQNSHPDFELSKFREFVEVSSNHEYLNEVQNGLTPNQAKYLENVVSQWDVTRSAQFKGRKGEGFDITFRSGKDYIVASYDDQGEIIMAVERFRNFALPKTVSISLARHYPNWKVIKNKYSVRYTRHNRPERNLKVQIRKDRQKKWLNIDLSKKIS